jgi:hypothetical protein
MAGKSTPALLSLARRGCEFFDDTNLGCISLGDFFGFGCFFAWASGLAVRFAFRLAGGF